MTNAQYERALCRFLALDTRRRPPQVVTCWDCQTEWTSIPRGFIYDDPSAGWRQDPDNQYVGGHCRSCANEIEASRSRYGSSHHEAWLIECESQEG
jgi:hypothetical protein